MTTLDGEVADTFEYGPYGELTSANKYGVLFLYNGEYGVATDANGLYYMCARYYNPEIKRFINQDVVIGEVTNTPSMNRYAYVQGNPISYVDPFGLSPGLGWKFWGHLALNVLGMLTMIPTPVTFAIGAIANIANAAWYASEGDWFSAAGCAVSLFGGAFKLLGAAGKAGQLSSFGCHLHQVMKYASCVGDIALGAYDMYKVGSNIYDKASKGELTFGDVLSATFQVGMDAMQIAGGIDGLGDKVRYCFVAGTPVETEDGQKPIEEIEVGDQVLSQDPVTGDVTYKTVLETSVSETTDLIHVFVAGEEIQTTPLHPFYVAKFGWTDAVNLRAGDVLVLSNGEYVVVEKVQHEILESPVKVYNFEVEDYHTYFVGENPIWVHNGKSCSRLPESEGSWSGERGESVWNSTNADVNSITHGEGITFKDGKPDFSKWSKGTITFDQGVLTGKNSVDFSVSYQAIMDAKGFTTKQQAAQWLKQEGLTLHHFSATEIQLIPTALHANVPHVGAASMLRQTGGGLGSVTAIKEHFGEGMGILGTVFN